MNNSDTNKINLHGYTVRKALELFIAYYNSSIQNQKDIKICVVHGYGSTGEGGKIRSALRNFLNEHNDRLQWFCGESIDGNAGTTYIQAIKTLPKTFENLAKDILNYCQTPKTKDKIAGYFRNHGDQCILKAIKFLEKKKMIHIVWKGKHKCYHARY